MDDYVAIRIVEQLPAFPESVFSVAMWVKADNASQVLYCEASASNSAFFRFKAGFAGRFEMDGRDENGANNFDYTSSLEPFDGKWHHIAWVDNNGSFTFYMDGVPDSGSYSVPAPA